MINLIIVRIQEISYIKKSKSIKGHSRFLAMRAMVKLSQALSGKTVYGIFRQENKTIYQGKISL